MNGSDDELTTECPTCKKKVTYRPDEKESFFPFCSERCKLIDLGRWFKEQHRISRSLEQTDLEENPGE